MNATDISKQAVAIAQPSPKSRLTAALAAVAALMFVSSPAQAVDGCQVLLCLAAPNWRAIPQCIPPINQLLRDLARAKAFPTCSMSGAGNTASHAWSNAPTLCPPQYTHVLSTESGPLYECEYAGAISVTVSGTLFSRTWWGMDGSTSTEFSPDAKAQLGTWDGRFDDDYAAWLGTKSPAADSTSD